MILAHHAGEEIIPTLVAGGGSAVSILLLVWRARLSDLVDRLSRRAGRS
jgi:hypothetical protein